MRSQSWWIVLGVVFAAGSALVEEPAPGPDGPVVEPSTVDETEPRPDRGLSHPERLLDDEALVAAVADHWAALPAERRADYPERRIDALLTEWPAPPRVTTLACADARASIEERDPSLDSATLIDGSLDALTEDSCRVVFFDGLLGPGLEAVLSPGGRVLLLRLIPEG
jgi:hypothetical protein